MPSLDLFPAVPYRDPWRLPLAARLEMLARRRRRVAYFDEQPNYGPFRYRVYNMAQALNDAGGDVSASWFCLDDLAAREQIADSAELLVICRARLDDRLAAMILAFRRRGKRVLFDVDDLVFDTDYTHLLIHAMGMDATNPYVWEHWSAYLSQVGNALRQCDGVIVTNEYLAERVRDYCALPVSVVPNFLNREQLDLSERIVAAKRDNGGAGEAIRLGYFSGSPSHSRDFDIVAPAIEAAMEQDPRLELAITGYIKAGPGLRRFGKRVKKYPLQDFLNLQRLVGSVDFNLIPLQYNAFTNCKSELKYFEAAIVGTVSIASPTWVYTQSLRHGDNGYLAQAHQWIGRIRHAATNPGEYPAMAQRALEDVKAKYTGAAQTAAILRALGL